MALLQVECHLQLNHTEAVTTSLKSAVAEAKESNNPEHLGQAYAFTQLIQRAHDGIYRPATGDVKTQFNIHDRAKRSAAYPFILGDMLAEVETAGNEAKHADGISPLVKLADDCATTRTIEKYVTQDSAKIDALGKEFAKSARGIIISYLKRAEKDVQDTSNSAHELVDALGTVPKKGKATLKVRRGMNKDEQADIREVATECGQVRTTIEYLEKAFAAKIPIPKTVPNADDIAKDARKLMDDFMVKYKED
jgi:hypothetical protein